jgi:hypothetical protein
MVKKKARATIQVPDPKGVMVRLEDRRFDPRDWPIQRKVATEFADSWLTYLSAECKQRGWQCSGLTQLDRRENSGTLIVRAADGVEQLTIVWERTRNGPLLLKAKPMTAEVTEFLTTVDLRCSTASTERFYRRGLLRYDGLPWLGELWLGSHLRLGAPSQQDTTALTGPRYILVDAEVDGIEWSDAASRFSVLLRELSVFLTVVLRTSVSVPDSRRDWTWTMADGAASYEVRQIGYGEVKNPARMPSPGETRSILTYPVSRPDFSIGGITASDNEKQVPDDIVSLWQDFENLSPEKRREFLQAGSHYQLALLLFQKFPTACFAFMVAACEALKPGGKAFEVHNAYDVVEALLGKTVADRLRANPSRPQDTRSVHFHRGEFRANEFEPYQFLSSFDDPTFDESLREIARVAHAAIIEWLRKGGVIELSTVRRRKTVRRRIRENALMLLPIVFVLGALVSALILLM